MDKGITEGRPCAGTKVYNVFLAEASFDAYQGIKEEWAGGIL